MRHFLGEIDYVAGSERELSLRSLEVKGKKGGINYIKNLWLDIVVTLTSASTSDAISQKETPAVVDLLTVLDNRLAPIFLPLPTKGNVPRFVNQLTKHSGPNDPAAIGANSNTSNTLRLLLNVPVRQPTLRSPMACRQPLARLDNGGKIKVKWAASNIYGTGQTIASVKCYVYCETEEADALVHHPEIEYRVTQPTKFVEDAIEVNGKLLWLALADLTADGTFAANDFDSFDLRGRGLALQRQSIDSPALAYNYFDSEVGDADDAQLPLPRSGSADLVPLVTNARHDVELSKLSEESELTWNLVVGAGNPAPADMYLLRAVVKRRDAAAWADSISRSSLKITAAQILASFNAHPMAEGFSGGVDPSHPEWAYLPMTVRNV